MSSKAETGCAIRPADYSQSAEDDDSLGIIFLKPTETSWGYGDHEVTCVIQDSTKKRSGSVKDG